MSDYVDKAAAWDSNSNTVRRENAKLYEVLNALEEVMNVIGGELGNCSDDHQSEQEIKLKRRVEALLEKYSDKRGEA